MLHRLSLMGNPSLAAVDVAGCPLIKAVVNSKYRNWSLFDVDYREWSSGDLKVGATADFDKATTVNAGRTVLHDSKSY